MQRNALEWFQSYSSRPPSQGFKALAVLIGVLLTVITWERRGAVAGLAALAVYGVVFAAAAFRHEATMSWSRAHPILDSALLAPLVFLAIASETHLSLALCAVIGLVAWLLLLPLTLRRRTARSAS